jgi:hypothetical protein
LKVKSVFSRKMKRNWSVLVLVLQPQWRKKIRSFATYMEYMALEVRNEARSSNKELHTRYKCKQLVLSIFKSPQPIRNFNLIYSLFNSPLANKELLRSFNVIFLLFNSQLANKNSHKTIAQEQIIDLIHQVLSTL